MRSPIVFEKPRADSTKAEAHWAMDSSLAPAQTISRMAIQKKGVLSRLPIVMPSPSSVRRSMGQVAKLKMLYSGIRDHSTASSLQCPIPNRAKKTVDRRITPTHPQQ